MSYSKYLRDNLVHSYSIEDADAEDDIATTDKISWRSRQVHDPHQEISDPDDMSEHGEFDVGTEKCQHSAQKNYGQVSEEDFKVNKGGYRESPPRNNWRDHLDDFFNMEEDDE